MQDDPETGECFQHKGGPESTAVGSGHTGGEWEGTSLHAQRIGRQRRPHLRRRRPSADRGVVEGSWQAHEYLRLSRKDRGVARRYLAKIGGRSGAPITRPRRLATELTYGPTG